jgi:hypothetical protein
MGARIPPPTRGNIDLNPVRERQMSEEISHSFGSLKQIDAGNR